MMSYIDLTRSIKKSLIMLAMISRFGSMLVACSKKERKYILIVDLLNLHLSKKKKDIKASSK